MTAPQPHHMHDEYFMEDQPPAAQLRGAMLASMLMDPPPKGPNAGIFAERKAAMAEPTSSAAGGFVLWKAFGGLAALAGIGAFLAAVVSMCMMTPRSPKEWAVGLVSTAVCSVCGGAYAILRLGLHQALPNDPASLYLAMVSAIGIVFACGLPGWAIVRAVFTWLDKNKDKDIGELAAAARADAVKVVSP